MSKEITINIGLYDEREAERVFHEMNSAKRGDSINLNINSIGGNMMCVFEAHKAMHRRGFSLNAASILMATSGVYFMAHDFKKIQINKHGRLYFIKSHVYTAEESPNYGSILRAMDQKIINAFSERSGKSIKSISKLMEHESELGAKDALLWGFVDEIKEEDLTIKL